MNFRLEKCIVIPYSKTCLNAKDAFWTRNRNFKTLAATTYIRKEVEWIFDHDGVTTWRNSVFKFLNYVLLTQIVSEKKSHILIKVIFFSCQTEQINYFHQTRFWGPGLSSILVFFFKAACTHFCPTCLVYVSGCPYV